MAHLSLVFHMASGTLASGGVQQQCGDTTGETQAVPEKRRFSRANTIDEIRLKRKKRRRKKRAEERKMSKKAISNKRKATFQKRANSLTAELQDLSKQMEKEREDCTKSKQQAVLYWRKWRSERSLRHNSAM